MKALLFFTCLLSALFLSGAATQEQDYSRLLALALEKPPDEPLLPLNDYRKEFDRKLNQENITFLNDDKALLERLRGRIAADTIKWRLDHSGKRTFFVPETRHEFIRLYRSYCRLAIRKVLAVTGADNPYSSDILMLSENEVFTQETGEAIKNIKIAVVRDLVDEYTESYEFYSPDSTTKVRLKLSNRTYTGRIGSYSSRMGFNDRGRITRSYEQYTVWQSNAKDPLNVLIAPIEETCHLLIREATENMIIDGVTAGTTEKQFRESVDRAMQVEEAVVRTMIIKFLPSFLAEYDIAVDNGRLKQIMNGHDLGQYRLVEKAMAELARLTAKDLFDNYRKDPKKIAKQLGS